MSVGLRRKPFSYTPAGAIIDGNETHLCVLGDDGWPHYTSVNSSDPARWRRALASLADPETLTLGKHRRPPLRKPIWIGLEWSDESFPPDRLLALVLLPKGRLSLVVPTELDDYCTRVGGSADCRFDRAELLAHYVLRVRPQAEDELLYSAGEAIGLPGLRKKAAR